MYCTQKNKAQILECDIQIFVLNLFIYVYTGIAVKSSEVVAS